MPPMPKKLESMTRTEYVMLVVAVILTMCIIAGACGYCGSLQRSTPMPEAQAHGSSDDEPMVEVEKDERIKVIIDEENDTACYVLPDNAGISCTKLWRYFDDVEKKEGDL